MKSKGRKHPKYKTYYNYKLRFMEERFPFLNVQQLRAKIISSWESLSLLKKNEWSPQKCSQKNGNCKNTRMPSSRKSKEHMIKKRSLMMKKTTENVPKGRQNNKCLMKTIAVSPGISNRETENDEAKNEDQFFKEKDLLMKKQDEGLSDSCKNINSFGQWQSLFEDGAMIKSCDHFQNSSRSQPLCGLFENAQRQSFSHQRFLGALNTTENCEIRDIFTASEDDIFM
ncbi:uncharacterized protein LOC124449589 [Xenia sp. Carnegie-2017]|uniref:uncharacterized protein LOC124449589 n=1 Tax=Xenia sp. Carnegie-2017 TaxID=2897299 RepID=UPI001F044B90|nr:uncharacterized protein LOC124449589 [Xenia sp. Carnegie-2017]